MSEIERCVVTPAVGLDGGIYAVEGWHVVCGSEVVDDSFSSDRDAAQEMADRLNEEAEQDELRRSAYEAWKARGAGLGDLDLRAAAQHAQTIGDNAAERQIDSLLSAREGS